MIPPLPWGPMSCQSASAGSNNTFYITLRTLSCCFSVEAVVSPDIQCPWYLFDRLF
ncbi:unnamed protein product [Staurois parvus]|uniref:Uncharacterized protein n=1 Tax=Staurois parvus TaxID=386267 RepID=A0ABN9FG46_9NEOB|nr:unnamed protein product [Staurois parvus]